MAQFQVNPPGSPGRTCFSATKETLNTALRQSRFAGTHLLHREEPRAPDMTSVFFEISTFTCTVSVIPVG